MRWLCAAIMALVPATVLAQRAWFQGMGIPPECSGSFAYALSADGRTVVGIASRLNEGLPFRWTAETSFEFLEPTLGWGGIGWHWYPEDVSDDGLVIVGAVQTSNGTRAWRWTGASGMVNLGQIANSVGSAWAYGVSADGSVVVGNGAVNGKPAAFRWTEQTGMEPIFPGVPTSWAYAITRDGSTIVGRRGGQGYRWNATFGLQMMSSESEVYPFAVSDDANVVVGRRGTTAFHWMHASGFSPGPFAFPGPSLSFAWGVSGDGSVVVGQSTTAFIWDATNGIRALRDVLVSDYGLDLEGWDLRSAQGISTEGRVITGIGQNPCGQWEGWVASLGPNPPCSADCNRDNLLSAPDFICFLDRFARLDRSANCDRSCEEPVLTANDFVCFLNTYGAGCD